MKTKRRDGGRYNVVVVGAGTAGLVTAAGTAGLGGRVALVERGRMGGDCLNTGCVPSKALISSARLIDQIRRAEKWGLEAQPPVFEFDGVFRRMRARRARLAVQTRSCLTAVRFLPYGAASWVGMLPGTFLYVLAGRRREDPGQRRKEPLRMGPPRGFWRRRP